MSEMETHVLEIMRGGIRKFNNFLGQIPDEFFGLQSSSKNELQKEFRRAWEENPYQTAKQIVDRLISAVVNDITCPDGKALRQILSVGANTDFAKPDLPEKPIFLGEMSDSNFEEKPFLIKEPKDIN